MNRAARLRKTAPGAPDDMVARLAGLPADHVALIAGLARQARRDALTEAAERKRRRRAEDRANGNYDEDDLLKRTIAVITSHGRRAQGGNVDALAALGQVRTHVDSVIGEAVRAGRAQGLSDKVIAEALGVTRQAVSQRWNRQDTLPVEEATA